MAISILVIDEHPVVQLGLSHIFKHAFEDCVVGHASNEPEALQQIQVGNWDVVVSEVAMPGRGGLEILKRIKVAKPKLPVLILSIYPEEVFAMRALKAGAAGYINKTVVPDKLIEAVQKVRRGQKYISERVYDQLLDQLSGNVDKAPHEILSDREYQVMQMLVLGQRVGAIAMELALSAKTVSTYRARVLRKMGMESNAELVRYAFEYSLV